MQLLRMIYEDVKGNWGVFEKETDTRPSQISIIPDWKAGFWIVWVGFFFHLPRKCLKMTVYHFYPFSTIIGNSEKEKRLPTAPLKREDIRATFIVIQTPFFFFFVKSVTQQISKPTPNQPTGEKKIKIPTKRTPSQHWPQTGRKPPWTSLLVIRLKAPLGIHEK